jgi:hypothetical protein
MADIFDWSATAASNTTVDGININTGMPVGNVDNALRSIMALVRNSFATALETFLNGSIPLPLANGGTAATDAATARTNLGLGTVATESTLPIAKGGTGATTAAAAFAAIAVAASSLGDSGYLKLQNGFMIQWGQITANANGTTAVAYPAAYATWSKCFVNGGNQSVGSTENNPFGVGGSGTTTGATVYNSENGPIACDWVAIGV